MDRKCIDAAIRYNNAVNEASAKYDGDSKSATEYLERKDNIKRDVMDYLLGLDLINDLMKIDHAIRKEGEDLIGGSPVYANWLNEVITIKLVKMRKDRSWYEEKYNETFGNVSLRNSQDENTPV